MSRRRNRWIEILLGFTAAFFAAVVLVLHTENQLFWSEDEIVDFSDGWYYVEDGEKKEISLPCTVTLSEDGEGLTIFHDPDDRLEQGLVLSMTGAALAPRICLGDTVLYQYDDTEFPRNAQMESKIYCQAALTDAVEDETLSITFQKTADGVYSLSDVIAGSQRAVLSQYLSNDVLNISVVILMWFLSGAAIAAFFYMRYCGYSDARFLHVAAFLLLCGGWCLTDSALFNYLTDYHPLVSYISFYLFMLFSLPLLYFLEKTGKLREYRRFRILEDAFRCNVLVQSVLHLALGLDFVRMLFLTHILLFAGVLWIADALHREYARSGGREIRTIGYAFFVLGAGGLLSLVLYWALKIYYYESIFEIGIATFILILLAGLVRDVTENLRYRTEMMIYQRLAREDRMTGLANRRAFEEFMSDFQMKTSKHRDAVLVFFDVNGLKQVNDTMGHAAGDEMIIMAAKSIENAFSSMGTCYRIGGDEFAAVLLHPVGESWEWYRKLDEQIRARRSETRIPLSIARGESCLTSPDGTLKSISEWKFEADMRMYRDKAKQKRLAEAAKEERHDI